MDTTSRRPWCLWLPITTAVTLVLAVGMTVATARLSRKLRKEAIRDRYERIEVGMTSAQVREVLGMRGGTIAGSSGYWKEQWDFRDYTITVRFAECVVKKKEMEPVPRPVTDQLRRLGEAIRNPF